MIDTADKELVVSRFGRCVKFDFHTRHDTRFFATYIRFGPNHVLEVSVSCNLYFGETGTIVAARSATIRSELFRKVEASEKFARTLALDAKISDAGSSCID